MYTEGLLSAVGGVGMTSCAERNWKLFFGVEDTSCHFIYVRTVCCFSVKQGRFILQYA